MQTEDQLIKKVKACIEVRAGRGKSESWVTQDFQALSEQIGQKTGIHLSIITLKRVWGRVAYKGAPSLTTLDALAQFIDHKNWRDFEAKQGSTYETETPEEHLQTLAAPDHIPKIKRRYYPRVAFGLLAAIAVVYGSFSFLGKAPEIHAEEYRFSSQKVVAEGIPNSVIFDLDARKAPFDSVAIQQTWDTTRRVSIPKSQGKYTAIYYYPGNFTAKLLVGNKVVKQHNLLIQSGGWLPLIKQSPIPAYLKKEDVIAEGKMGMSYEQAIEKAGLKGDELPNIYFYNTRDFGAIYTDNFVFETAVKNEHKKGSGACQKTYVMLQCVDNFIMIPLCAKGCVSNLNLFFTSYYSSGKSNDLSAFGVDFTDYVKLRIEAKGSRSRLFVNEQLAYTINDKIDKAKIVGICFYFQGAGSVDYVKLSNGNVQFEDSFDK